MALGQVPHMQTIMAENLRRGIGDLGDTPLRRAQFGLEKTKTLYDIGRQQEADKRAKELYELGLPGAKVEARKNQQFLNEMEQPVTAGMFMKNMGTAEQMLWTRKDRYPEGDAAESEKKKTDYSDPLIVRAPKILYGATLDTNPNSPTFKQFIKPDGSVLEKGEILSNPEPLKAIMMANSGQKHKIQAAREELDM